MQSSSTQLIAQAVYNPQLSASLRDLSGWEFINNIVPYFVLLGFIIGVLAFFFMLVIGGVQWITSGGDKARVEDARRKVTHAFIGLFLLFIIYAILRLINILFGIDIGNIGGGSIVPPISPGAPTCRITGSTNICALEPRTYHGECWDYDENLTQIIISITPVDGPGLGNIYDCFNDPDGVDHAVCNVSHTITAPGSYYVTITGVSDDGTCGGMDCDYITVTAADCGLGTAGTCVDRTTSCACSCEPGDIPVDDSGCNVAYPACTENICICMPYEDVYEDQLLLHYALNETSGTTVSDETGRYNGTLLDPSGDSWSTVGCGGSLYSNADNGTIQSPPSTEGGAFHTPSFTYAAWINPDSQTSGYVWSPPDNIVIDNNSSGGIWLAYDRNDDIDYEVQGILESWVACGPRGRSTLRSSRRLPLNEWHHVAFTYSPDNAELRLYIDGVLDNTQPYTLGPATYPCENTSWLCEAAIGQNCYPGGGEMLGYIDDARIYNYALPSSAISGIYNSCTPVPPLYFNSATGQNCNDFCSNRGLTCVYSGTDPQGTNSRAAVWMDSWVPPRCTIESSVTPCTRVITDFSSNLCQDLSGNNADPNPYPADWTYCNCQ